MIRSMLLLLCACLLMGGCAMKTQSRYFSENGVPYDGKPLKEGTWEGMAQARVDKTDEQLAAQSLRGWFLPLLLNIRSANVSRDGETIRVSQFTWNDLASPLLLTTLPLRVKYRQYVYTNGQLEPTGFRSVTWSPLTFEDRAIGTVDHSDRIKGKGVPFFYSRLHASAERGPGQDGYDVRLTNTLWTLGPTALRVSLQPSTDDRPTSNTGYFAAPLLLGGGLGSLLWCDYVFRANDDFTKLSGHGPLFGMGVLFHVRQAEAEQAVRERGEMVTVKVPASSTRHVLGGILWHDYKQWQPGQKEVDFSRHGILWSAFGYKKRDGRTMPRFLFLNLG